MPVLKITINFLKKARIPKAIVTTAGDLFRTGFITQKNNLSKYHKTSNFKYSYQLI